MAKAFSMLAKNKLALSLAMALVISAFLSILYMAGFLSSIQLGLTDNFYSEKPLTGNIVIVGVDDKSLQEIGRWPWNRDNFSAIIDALETAGVKTIGFDISFFEQTDHDPSVDSALAKYANVIMVMEYTNFSSTSGSLVGTSKLVPVFRSPVKTGYANVFTDDDGIVRSLPSAIRDANASNAMPFSQAVLSDYQGLQIVPADKKMVINYFGPPGRFPYASFSDVLQNKSGIDFNGKIVLVGATAASLRDTFLTPISRATPMPGVEVHANAIETLQSGMFLHYEDSLSVILSIIVLCILASLIIYKLRVVYSTVAIAILAIAYVFAAAMIFDAGIIANIVYPVLSLISVYIAHIAIFYVAEKKQRSLVTNIFGKYVAKEVASEILKKATTEELDLKGEKRDITIMFTDIRKFTTISEKMQPHELVAFLNKYLSEMTEIIMKRKGVVDKYIGDAIMAFWGAPLDEKGHAALACEAALDMKKKLEESKSEFKIGIGINTGEAIVGNMGSAQRVNYTVIGDSVNAASRIEGLNKEYGTMIILGEKTFKEISGYACRELDLIKVKGKEIPIRIYELLGRKSDVDEKTINMKNHFEAGLALYRKGEWKNAIEEFRAAQKILPDAPSDLFIKRCQLLSKHAPEEWDGVYTFTTK